MSKRKAEKGCPVHGTVCSGSLCGSGPVEGRDPCRIEVVLGLLRTYWTKYPGLRLGQIIGNLTGETDPYHVEDTVLVDKLRAALKEPKDGYPLPCPRHGWRRVSGCSDWWCRTGGKDPA
jgi:hypothetical protein